MEELAFEAFDNMRKHAEKAKECQLGKDTGVFAGVTLVSDYVAHPHKDASDFAKGVIGLFSFKNASIAAQACHISDVLFRFLLDQKSLSLFR